MSMTRKTTMKRLAPLLALVLCAAAMPAQATDFSAGAVAKASPYRDLPGVKPPEKNVATPDDGFTCDTEIGDRRYRRDIFDRYAGSGIVYSCSRDGVTVESSRAPRRGWIPGQPQYGWPWGE